MADKPTRSKAVAKADFPSLVAEVKGRIQAAQARAIFAVNAELVRLYWDVGRIVRGRQANEGWGAGVIPRLSRELHNELPDLKGFSERNIKLMVQFSSEYPGAFAAGDPIGQRLPSPQSDLARQTLKDPYIFDFLTLAEPFQERELETGLVRHLEKFLLELGQGLVEGKHGVVRGLLP